MLKLGLLTAQLDEKPTGRDKEKLENALEKAGDTITHLDNLIAAEMSQVKDYVKKFVEFRQGVLEKAASIVQQSRSITDSK